MTAKEIRHRLEVQAHPEKRDVLASFFKTGKGEYGEGDIFIGLTVPENRKIAKEYKALNLLEVEKLLTDPIHECRLCALIILIEKFKKGNDEERQSILDLYLLRTEFINNWDLVDLSCRDIVGEYLVDKPDRSILYELANSSVLWEQRIAIVSTYAFIRRNDFKDILCISQMLLGHKHDLIHKAIGWMLREVGKRDKQVLINFLEIHKNQMPRTALRYAIEKFSNEERAYFMKR